MVDESLWERIRPPLWARWGLSLLIAAGAAVALILFVHAHSNNDLAHVSRKAEAREGREAEVVVGQDQAPQTVRVPAGASAQARLTQAVRADMRHRIAIGNVDGTLKGVGCRRTGARGGAVAYTCTAHAEGVAYPFLAVSRAASHSAVYCKRDYPPVPSENIPVSGRCRLS